MSGTYAKIAEILRRLSAILQQLSEERGNSFAPLTPSERLFKNAYAKLGTDASPSDIAGDDLGCAESVTEILGEVIDFPIILGTWTLNERLKADVRFVRTDANAGRGTIIISPTGMGNGKIRGHVGILGDGSTIMSASSHNGLWEENYTVDAWKSRYKTLGGLPVYYYSLVTL